MRQFSVSAAELHLDGPAGQPTGEGAPAVAAVGGGHLLVTEAGSGALLLQAELSPDVAWRAGETLVLVAGTSAPAEAAAGGAEAAAGGKQLGRKTLALRCSSTQDAQQLWDALREGGGGGGSGGGGQQQGPAGAGACNLFDAKTDKGSADLYFHYYGMLQHQQNMLQDTTRTGTYNAAILENRADFEGKVVMDVGAGSGILSLFAAQAGARKVLAVEASGMAKFAQQLACRNPAGKVIQVCHSKVEELDLPRGCADVLVSEPMGTLLVNERMLETYLFARDRFLKPGGKMFPHLGRIHAAAFSDLGLHNELLGKAAFWQQGCFFGIDMTPLHQPAVDGYFGQVVVDAFDPSVLVSDCASRVFDFATMKEEELHDITIPLNLTVAHPCSVHGVATWFDVLFNGSTSQRWLSTAPGLPTTHWFQLRCCLQQPLHVLAPNTRVTGVLRMVAHERQSYDVHLELNAPPVSPGLPPQTSSGTFDMKEPYYRQLTTWAQQQLQAVAPVVQQQQAQPQTYVLPALALAVPAAAAAAAAGGGQPLVLDTAAAAAMGVGRQS